MLTSSQMLPRLQALAYFYGSAMLKDLDPSLVLSFRLLRDWFDYASSWLDVG
jgi:hypothetical protein